MINSSGFFLFCSDHRPQIKAQYPSLGIGDMAKKLGEMWNSLTDSTKQPYLIKANKLKDKYQKARLDLSFSSPHVTSQFQCFDILTIFPLCAGCCGLQDEGQGWGVSMGMGMMANCMAPKPMVKSNMGDEEDDEEEDDEERMMMNMMTMNRLTFLCVWSVTIIITISPPLKSSRYGIHWWSFIAPLLF